MPTPVAPLSRKTFVGPWAGVPIAWTDDDRFDEETYRRDLRACCEAGVPAIYTGGTTGEFYAIEREEFEAVTRATIDEAHAGGRPAMIGCTSNYTLGAQRRAEFAAEHGADAIQLALPFWNDLRAAEIVPFFRDVAKAASGIPISIYDTLRAKRVLTVEEHRAVHEAVPTYLHVKATAGAVGATPGGCRELRQFVNVFVGEPQWAELGPYGARGACSAMIYWSPRLVLRWWRLLETAQWTALADQLVPVKALIAFLFSQFGSRGFTDTAFDRLGARAGRLLHTSLRCRGPYVSPTEEDVTLLRSWYAKNFPEMLECNGARTAGD